jgi:hypothetical protein
MSDAFLNDSSLNLENFLSKKFSAKVRAYIEDQEKQKLPASADEIQSTTDWTVARPPHKHRYLYQEHSTATKGQASPIQELLNGLLPSKPFRKWLALITGADRITSYNFLGRRFRRGQDYTLASSYAGEEPRLEFTLCLTPTSGWEKENPEGDDEAGAEKDDGAKDAKEPSGSSSAQKPTKDSSSSSTKGDEPSVGGYEIYMAGDDDEDEDAAIYRSAADDEDDGILFSTAAGWNRLSIVLRDSGTLRFVKYVSAAAKGDRWDVTGEMGVEFGDDDGEDEGDGDEEGEDEVEEDED